MRSTLKEPQCGASWPREQGDSVLAWAGSSGGRQQARASWAWAPSRATILQVLSLTMVPSGDILPSLARPMERAQLMQLWHHPACQCGRGKDDGGTFFFVSRGAIVDLASASKIFQPFHPHPPLQNLS